MRHLTRPSARRRSYASRPSENNWMPVFGVFAIIAGVVLFVFQLGIFAMPRWVTDVTQQVAPLVNQQPAAVPTAVVAPRPAARPASTGRQAGNQDLRPYRQQTADTANAQSTSSEQNTLDALLQPTPLPASPAEQVPQAQQPAGAMSPDDLRSPAQATADTVNAQASEEQNTLNALNQMHALEQATAYALSVQTQREAEAEADRQAAAEQAAVAATTAAENQAVLESSDNQANTEAQQASQAEVATAEAYIRQQITQP